MATMQAEVRGPDDWQQRWWEVAGFEIYLEDRADGTSWRVTTNNNNYDKNINKILDHILQPA